MTTRRIFSSITLAETGLRIAQCGVSSQFSIERLCDEQTSSSRAAASESEETCDMLDSGPPASSWEPMLCSEAEEGQAPLSLELLYHSAQTTSPSDAVMVAANLLMTETGFVPEVRLQGGFILKTDAVRG